MSVIQNFPTPAAPIADANGRITDPWRALLDALWRRTGGAPGGVVSSVFGRAGAIVAAVGDYTFTQIAGKPTTLAGYGITDAAPSARAIATGTGLTGGGDLSANRTIALAAAAAGTIGGVLKAATSANATTSTVAPSAAYVQAEAAQVVTDLNAAIASLNDLKAKLRASGALT